MGLKIRGFVVIHDVRFCNLLYLRRTSKMRRMESDRLSSIASNSRQVVRIFGNSSKQKPSEISEANNELF